MDTSAAPAAPDDDLPVLLVTARSALVEDVKRLAAAVGVGVRVAPDAAAAGREWVRAPLVLLGDDAAALGVPVHRPGALLVAGAGSGERVWRLAVQCGARGVAVLPDDEPVVLAHLARAGEAPGPPGRVVGVLGGSGGVGASVLAAVVAGAAASTGRRVLLVDGDPLGGGLDVLLGAEQDPGLRWPDLRGARGSLRAALLTEALPRVGGLSVLSWSSGPGADGGALPAPAPPAAVEAVLEAAPRAFDLVVWDLPRGHDPATLTTLWRLDLLVLVARTALRPVLAARVVREHVAQHVGDVRLVLAAAGADVEVVPPARAVDALELPLLGRVQHDPAVPTALAAGRVGVAHRRRSVARCAAALLDAAGEPRDLDPALRATGRPGRVA